MAAKLKLGSTTWADLLGHAQPIGANGAVVIENNDTVVITKLTAAALTLPAPDRDGQRMAFVSATAATHTVAGSFNGDDATATFGGAKGDTFTAISYGGTWYVMYSVNVTVA